jgi:hypothetical protein
MKLLPKQLVFCGLFVALWAFIAVLAIGQSAPQPVLTIVPTNGNQFQLIITNGVASTNYEIYRTPFLADTNYPWTLQVAGDVGQTNFILDKGLENMGFFRAALGLDWDGDGIPNSRDGNPNDPSIGILTITIDSPTNGMILN